MSPTTAPERPGPAPAVAYVVSRWGEPTQTFVRREAAAVADAADVRVLSIKRPRRAQAAWHVTYHPVARVAIGALRTTWRHPRVVARLVATIVRRASARNVVLHLVACAVGLSWADADEDADLFHAHFGWVAATAAWAVAAVRGRPFSVVLHAFELHAARYQDDFTPVPLRAAVQVFTISDADAELVRRRSGLDAHVLRMGVSDDWFVARGEEERDAWQVVSVASLVEKKGHDVLLRALASSDPRWRLCIVGDGPARPALERLAVDLGVVGRLELPGVRSERDVRETVGRAAAFVLAARVATDGDRDGIPVALMEAMAAGTPVITTDTGAIPELVAGAGILVPPDDPVALAAALDGLDADRRRVLSRRGRARAWRIARAEVNAAPVVALARGALPVRGAGRGHRR